MKHHTKITEQQRELIIRYFYNNHDNRDLTIANYFGLNRMTVSDVIADHLEEKMKRINKEIDNRLKQRNEPKQNNQDTLKS